MNNLVLRIITGIVGAVALLGLIYIGNIPFFLLVMILSIIGIIELYKMLKKSMIDCYMFLGISVSICISVLFYLSKGHMFLLAHDVLLPALLSLFVLVSLTASILSIGYDEFSKKLKDTVFTVFGLMYVSWMFNHLILVRELPIYGRNLVYLLFFSVWSLDTFAYFFGMKFGKHKLAEKISPKKSIEGSIAGFVSCLLVCFFVRYIMNTGLSAIDSLILGALIGIFGQIGDLAESLIKRSVGCKDSGAILPGHGGVLDRFDSILFAAPILYYYIKIFV